MGHGTFTGRDTYNGDDILTHARAWTGYDLADQRSNIELLRRENYIDDLVVVPERHNPFPKADLAGGFIGDRYPLCGEVDASFGGSFFEHVGAGADAQVLDESDPL